MYSVVNDFLGISQKFSEQLFQRTQLVGCFWFRLITCFFICNTFARMPDWNLQNIKQKLSNNLKLNFCYLKIICFLHQYYHQKITRDIKKKKCDCFNDAMLVMAMELRLKTKNGSQRYKINKSRPRHGSKYTKYKTVLVYGWLYVE